MARNKAKLTRRSFIKKSSATASLLTVFPYSTLTSTFNISDDKRILVIEIKKSESFAKFRTVLIPWSFS